MVHDAQKSWSKSSACEANSHDGAPLRDSAGEPSCGDGWRGNCGRPDGGAELLDCRFTRGAGTRAPGQDEFDVLDPDPGQDLAKIAAGLIVFLYRRTRAEVTAACQDNGRFLAGEQADIIRRHRHADPNDLVDIGLEDRGDGEVEHRRADDDLVGRLELGDELVRDLYGGGVFRRMLLTRHEGTADPGMIDERRGRLHQIADDDCRAGVRGFPRVDEMRGERSGRGEPMARTDLDSEQGGHLRLLCKRFPTTPKRYGLSKKEMKFR